MYSGSGPTARFLTLILCGHKFYLPYISCDPDMTLTPLPLSEASATYLPRGGLFHHTAPSLGWIRKSFFYFAKYEINTKLK